jgi:hypothetical protein
MATNVYVYDLDNYPDTAKTVVVDLKSVVTLGAGGDEQWVVSASTTATSSGSASIQDIFVRDTVLGWAKSNGIFQGPYTVNASQNTMKVSINGSTYRTITLTNQTLTVPGSSVAEDMQTKIQNLSITGQVEAGNLAFKNATVDFSDGKFTIKSGVNTPSYTGSNRSSVEVLPGASNDISCHLGFFATNSSYSVASNSVRETYLDFPYTSVSGLTFIDVYDPSVAATGNCIGITDGTNSEYRYVSSVTASSININAALTNNYAAYSRVQVLKFQDPDSVPASSFDSIDDAVRFAITGLVNQIDFS